MTPTQAQIDAAQNDLFKRYGIAVGTEELRTALTAAAQVGETELEKENRLMNATIASSAVEIFELQKKLAATIEQCAQVAEDWGLGRVNQTVKDYPATCAAAIAFAIRALATEERQPS